MADGDPIWGRSFARIYHSLTLSRVNMGSVYAHCTLCGATWSIERGREQPTRHRGLCPLYLTLDQLGEFKSAASSRSRCPADRSSSPSSRR